MYNRHVFYHALGSDPDEDPLIFGEGRDPEDWPNVSLDNDGRLLLITVEQGWTKTELFLMDLKKGTPPTRITTGKNFLYQRDGVQRQALHRHQRRCSALSRVHGGSRQLRARRLEGNHSADRMRCCRALGCGAERLFAQYEQNATSQLKIFDLDGNAAQRIRAARARHGLWIVGGKWNRDEVFYGFQSFTVPPSIYRFDLKTGETSLWAKVDAPSIDPAAYEVQQEWFHSKDGTRVPMFLVHKKGLKKDGHNPTLLTGYGGFNVSLTPAFSRALICGWSTAEFSPSRTCAAAPSLAKTGTAPACSTRSRMSSTT